MPSCESIINWFYVDSLQSRGQPFYVVYETIPDPVVTEAIRLQVVRLGCVPVANNSHALVLARGNSFNFTASLPNEPVSKILGVTTSLTNKDNSFKNARRTWGWRKPRSNKRKQSCWKKSLPRPNAPNSPSSSHPFDHEQAMIHQHG